MGRINKTKEDKFRHSLKLWSEYDTRPFIREKEDLIRDRFDYERKEKWIREEKERIAKITGDKLDKIHIWSSRGLVSHVGCFQDWTIKKEENKSEVVKLAKENY